MLRDLFALRYERTVTRGQCVVDVEVGWFWVGLALAGGALCFFS